MLFWKFAISSLLFVPLVAASFRAFEGYDPSIQINFGISSSCLTALYNCPNPSDGEQTLTSSSNTTVDCDSGTANLAALGVDYNCV
jgi:hypothetical protein